MSVITDIVSCIRAFFNLLQSYFSTKTDNVSGDVTQEAEQMQSEIAQEETDRPTTQSDILKRLKDHDA